MLLKLWHILLRFGIGDVAVASDVEKAFLQVQLKDGDATRFLWLKDVNQPVIRDNLIIYRFNRVTFGLICSPFLLAGTIKYHLEHNSINPGVSHEILNNTYVDDEIMTIMTAKSTAEAIHLYKSSKAIFGEMRMNLREFISNDENLREQISKEDLSGSTTQKILGILWDSSQDELILTWMYPSREKITKRSISEQVASIYDPLGWMTPITLHGKRFLQHLWKCDYSWDEILSHGHQQQWKDIVEEVNDFRCKINRRITQINHRVEIVVISDASNTGMAEHWHAHTLHRTTDQF